MQLKINSILLIALVTCSFSKINKLKDSLAIAPTDIDGLYKFTGKLNGKIPVFLWFRVKDSVLKGEVTYLKTAKKNPITIIGTIKNAGEVTFYGTAPKQNIISFYEFGKGGHVTGHYKGEFKRNELAGAWTAFGKKIQLNFRLLPQDTLLAHIDTAFTPVSVDGDYEYHLGRDGKGANGRFSIKQMSPANYLIQIVSDIGEPSHNIASIDTTKVTAKNNVINYKVPYGDCTFKMKIFKDFIVVDRPFPGLQNCGFGLNASIDGIFIKTGDVAKFEPGIGN